MDEARKVVIQALKRCQIKYYGLGTRQKSQVRDSLSSFIYERPKQPDHSADLPRSVASCAEPAGLVRVQVQSAISSEHLYSSGCGARNFICSLRRNGAEFSVQRCCQNNSGTIFPFCLRVKFFRSAAKNASLLLFALIFARCQKFRMIPGVACIVCKGCRYAARAESVFKHRMRV